MPRRSPCRLFRFRSRANYRNGMPGDRASTPIRTTVTLSAPNRASRPGRAGASGDRLVGGHGPALDAAETALLDEHRLLTGDELTLLAELPDPWVTSLAALAHQVRLEWCGPEVEVEGILSAKTGGCPEDCHFCSQSSQFDSPVKATPFLDTDEVLRAAEETKAAGASEFCLVLAVRGPDERTMGRILELVPIIRDRTGLNVAVSAGLLTDAQARRFAEGGVHRYNHNLETSRSFFPQVVSTHSWEERRETCRLVRNHGMELCCGALDRDGRERRAADRAAPPTAGARSHRGPPQFLEPPARHPARATSSRSPPGRPSAGSPSSVSACPG